MRGTNFQRGPRARCRDGDVRPLAAEQLPVRHVLRRIPDDADHTVIDGELVCGRIEFGGGQPQQLLLSRGGGLAQLRAGLVHRAAARGLRLIDGLDRIAGNHVNAVEGDIEFLGHHLGKRSKNSCPQVHFAGVNGDDSVAPDLEPGIEFGRLRRAIGVGAGLAEGLAQQV